MLVQLVLDPHGQYTNLDVVTGRVILQNPSNATISHITVKLEGEARTRLLYAPPPRPNQNQNQAPRPVLEVHKLLYKVVQVFPPEGTQVPPVQRPSYILNPGSYTYPFQFKFPFNNSCSAQNNLSTNLNFAGFSLEVAKTPTQHVKTTLPPSIYYPGEAEIRYFLKVTVNRPSLLKENPRAFANLTFVPIEPPRGIQDGEVYARRQHQFVHDVAPALPERKGSAFGSIFKVQEKSSTPSSPSSGPLPPARFSIDARLPNPAILTCGQDLPIRLILKQLSERSEPLFLQTLQITLVGYTKVRAHEAVRTETNPWVIVTLSNLNQPIGSPADVVDTEIELTKELWYGHRLPDTVAPSFITCNISRSYMLEIQVGFAYGSLKSHHQTIVLPLRINVEVFSGIKPPPELLKRMDSAPPRPNPVSIPVQGPNPSNLPQYSVQASSSVPESQGASAYEEPPPSYEDAVGHDLPPIDGPRPGYNPPPAPEGESRITENEKRGGGG